MFTILKKNLYKISDGVTKRSGMSRLKCCNRLFLKLKLIKAFPIFLVPQIKLDTLVEQSETLPENFEFPFELEACLSILTRRCTCSSQTSTCTVNNSDEGR